MSGTILNSLFSTLSHLLFIYNTDEETLAQIDSPRSNKLEHGWIWIITQGGWLQNRALDHNGNCIHMNPRQLFLPKLSRLVVTSLGGTEVQIRRSLDRRFQTRSQWLQNPSTFHSPSLCPYADSERLLESLNASEILFPWLHLHWKLLREYSWLTTHRAPHTRLGTCGRARLYARARTPSSASASAHARKSVYN